jgi:hypothetical protein
VRTACNRCLRLVKKRAVLVEQGMGHGGLRN